MVAPFFVSAPKIRCICLDLTTKFCPSSSHRFHLRTGRYTELKKAYSIASDVLASRLEIVNALRSELKQSVYEPFPRVAWHKPNRSRSRKLDWPKDTTSLTGWHQRNYLLLEKIVITRKGRAAKSYSKDSVCSPISATFKFCMWAVHFTIKHFRATTAIPTLLSAIFPFWLWGQILEKNLGI